MPNSNVPEKLAVLREKFLARVVDDLDCLQQDADQFGASGDRAALRSVYHRLHRLAGSAGTFGLPDLGLAARKLEKALKSAVEQGGTDAFDKPVTSRLAAELVSGLDLLRSLVTPGDSTVPGDGVEKWAPPGQVRSSGNQTRLVIVDQDEKRSAALQQALCSYGFESAVVTGDDRYLEEQQYQINSPDITAFLVSRERLPRVREICEQTRNPDKARIPLLAVGGEDCFENRYALAENGARAFFPHPVHVPELVERIEKLSADQMRASRGRVILVEDDRELAEHYRLVLQSSDIEVSVVNDPTGLMSAMAAFRPDLVLMDVQLDGFSGIHLARMIRFDAQWLSLPIIYLSSEDDPDIQLDALSKGADDFLMKPVSDDYLVRSVRIRCFRARQLSDLMNQDSLTGLLKHSMIKQAMAQEVARCRREGHASSVVMVDLDHFKAVNDTWGHVVGDTVIKSLANLLRNRLRETDLIGRYGGEEFLVVMAGCDLEDAEKVISGIAASFSELAFAVGEERFHVTLSAGIAPIQAFGNADEAVNAADSALYQRKRAGRNGVTVFRPGHQDLGQEAP